MASLLNKYIYETFKGLIKTLDNEPIDGTLKPLSDGEGNELPIKVSETDVEVGFLTSKNLFIEEYGEVIDQNGNWTGPTIGISGTSGTSGTSGAAGTSGTSGANGSSGQTGSAGTSGTSGTRGTSGTDGTSGTSGIGSSGTSGTSGINGGTGSSGTSGLAGTSGTSGQNGTSGANGTSGTSGISQPGTPGTSGTSGTNGSAGTSGTNGSAGTSGTSGSNGISGGRIYYFNNSQSSDIAPYKVLADEPTVASLQTITKTIAGNSTGNLVQEFLTPGFGFTIIPSGIQRFHFHALKPQQNDDIQIYATLQLANASGIGYSPIFTTSANVITWNDAVTPSETTVDIVFPHTVVGATDRMIVKVYLINNTSTSKIVNWYTEDGEYSYVTTSVGAASGTSGTSGTSGINGTSGLNGAQGAQGAQGANGTSGINGTSGTSGINGAQGAAGTSGTNGSSGTSGIGTNGTSGTNGTAGTSGSSGTSGGGGSSIDSYTTVRGILQNIPGSTTSIFYKMNAISTTFGAGTQTIANNTLGIFPVTLAPGQTINEIAIETTTATTPTGNVTLALYKAATDANGNIIAGALEKNFGTIDVTTAAVKAITNVNHTLGTTTDSTYWCAIFNKSGVTVTFRAASNSTTSANGTWMSFGSTLYRAGLMNNTAASGGGSATLPTDLTGTQGTSWTNEARWPLMGFK